ncbi:MAG: nucleoside hydrolase, partial [Nitrospinota bacterium]
MVAPRSLLLDCDPGVDDALAIALALASPEVKLEAITVVAGNCAVDRATGNALRVVETCHGLAPWEVSPLPPVYRGASRPLRGGEKGGAGAGVGDAEFVHGPGGLGGVGEMRGLGG